MTNKLKIIVAISIIIFLSVLVIPLSYNPAETFVHGLGTASGGFSGTCTNKEGGVVNITKNVNITAFDFLDGTGDLCSDCYILNYSGDCSPTTLATGSVSGDVCVFSTGVELTPGRYIFSGLDPGQNHDYYTTAVGIDNSTVYWNNFSFNAAAGGTCDSHGIISQVSNITLQEQVNVFEITSISLTSPADGYSTTPQTIDFLSTGTVQAGNFTNATLYIWNSTYDLYITNFTTITGISNSTNRSISSFDTGTYNWNYEYCATNVSLYNCSFATTNRTFNINSFTVNDETWSNTTTKGATEWFELNVTIVSGSQISTANLIYNNTVYAGTVTNPSTDFYSIYRTIVIPNVSSNLNNTFYWNVVLDDGTEENTTEHNQTVYTLSFDDCSSYTNVLYNFTIVDEKTQTQLSESPIQNTSGKVDLQLYDTSGDTLIENFSGLYNGTTDNPFSVCLNDDLSSGGSYKIDVQVEYDADGYAKELYHIQQTTISASNLNTNITLYDLDDTSSEEFKIKYKDENFLPVADALIQIQRKYVDEGVFKTIEIPKTDSDGEALAHLELNDALYKIIVVKNGETLATFIDKVAYCPNPSLERCEIKLNAIGTSIQPSDYTVLDDFTFTLNYNKTSRVVSSAFTIPSSVASTVLLNVTLFDEIGNYSVCTDTLTSSAGTLSCTVPLSFGNSTVIAEIQKDGVLMGQAILSLAQDADNLYGGSIMFIGLLLFITLIGVGVGSNPIITGVFMLIGAVLSLVLNLVDKTAYIGKGATILWLFIAIILIIIKASKRE